jgi:hypothetical protein
MRQRFPFPVRLDAAGNGEVTFTARGDVQVQHTRVSVAPIPPAIRSAKIPIAQLYLNGVEWEGSVTGNGDDSDTHYLMLAQDQLRCVWTAGDPQAFALLVVRGIEYPAGQGIAATT